MKMAGEVSMAYIREILPKTSFPKFILQDNGTEFKNEQLMSVFDLLGVRHIYSNPYYPKGNSRIENLHNFLKCTIAKFTYSSQLEVAFPLVTYCLIYPHQWMTLGLHFIWYMVETLFEGRFSNLQNYCRYVGDQPGQLALQELRKMWKLHAKLLTAK